MTEKKNNIDKNIIAKSNKTHLQATNFKKNGLERKFISFNKVISLAAIQLSLFFCANILFQNKLVVPIANNREGESRDGAELMSSVCMKKTKRRTLEQIQVR